MKDVTKGVRIPDFYAVSEVIHGRDNVMGMSVPRVMDDGCEIGVIEPHHLKLKGFGIVGMHGGRGGVEENGVMVKGYSQ